MVRRECAQRDASWRFAQIGPIGASRRLGVGLVVGSIVACVILAVGSASDARAADSWSITTVDTAGNTGEELSLALDASGRPHIGYYDLSDGALKYALFDGTAWSISTVDTVSRFPGSVSLALDADGRPHLSYFNDGLRYAVFDGVAWSISTVDSDGHAFNSSLALDASGRPHISYSGWDYTKNGFVLNYAVFDGAAWSISTVDNGSLSVGFRSSLALDATGRPHISYESSRPDRDATDVKYAMFDGTAWSLSMVDNSSSVSYPSLALDASGHPHISYIDGLGFLTHMAVKYAVFDGTTWSISGIDIPNGRSGPPSISLDAAGRAHISHVSTVSVAAFVETAALNYAVFDEAAWSTWTVDGPRELIRGTSLALDTSGRPWISYVYANITSGDGDLMPAQRVTASASLTITPEPLVAGGAASIVGEGFDPGEPVLLELLLLPSTWVDLGSFAADTNGHIAGTVVIPQSTTAGTYQIFATGTGNGQTAAVTVTVTATIQYGLPKVGTDPTVVVAVALGLLLAGIFLLRIARRRGRRAFRRCTANADIA